MCERERERERERLRFFSLITDLRSDSHIRERKSNDGNDDILVVINRQQRIIYRWIDSENRQNVVKMILGTREDFYRNGRYSRPDFGTRKSFRLLREWNGWGT